MTVLKKYDNCFLEKDENDIVWLLLDKENSTTNTLHTAFLLDIESALVEIESLKTKLKGLIIKSNKKNGFIAGADIKQFSKLKTESDAIKLIKQGQNIFNKLANLSIPTLALINGFCVGGGLELALACDYRVALEDTKLGLPEVEIGWPVIRASRLA